MSASTGKRLQLAVLISGGGTTLRNLVEKLAADSFAEIVLVVSSSASAPGMRFAEKAGLPVLVADRGAFGSDQEFSAAVFERCRQCNVDYAVMGGFLKYLPIPPDFENRVLNIHPALIPAFCGKGFYGARVHQAVLDYGAKVSGCTVHFVDNQYDHGPIILQRVVPVLADDTPETLAARVFEAECEAYPAALRLLAEGRVTVLGRSVRVQPAADSGK